MSEKIFNNVKITSSFDIPEAKENLVSGETIGKHFGKIAKHMEDESIHHTVDDKLSITSTNPLQNKVATEKFASKEIYGGTTINVGRMVATTVGANSSTIGVENIASGMMSFAEGYKTTASGSISHAEGRGTITNGDCSHAEGFFTITNNEAEHASGQYNVSNEDTLFSIGDGTSDDERHNAFEITKTGGKLHNNDIATKSYKIDSSDAFTTDRTIVGIKDELETVVYREYIKYGTSGETNKYWRIYNGSGLYSDIRGTVEGTTAVWNFSKSNGITDININVDGKKFYHEGYKPYVIITTSIPANATTVTTNHGFQPSIVFYHTGIDIKVAKSATTTTITIDETSTTARSITYVIFR